MIPTSAGLEAGAVKPLEWLSEREPFTAYTPFCYYRVSPVNDDTGSYWAVDIHYRGASFHRSETEAEAKAFAQSDFVARIRSALIPPSRAADLIVALRALLLPADEIDRQAGQMDPLTQAPVKISHDAIIDLRNAIDKADSLLAEIEEKTVDQ